jgi:hypothetical protein
MWRCSLINYIDHKREDGNSLSQVQNFMCLLKDECIRYGSNLEARTFVVNQDQVFEEGFQMKANCVWSKVEL